MCVYYMRSNTVVLKMKDMIYLTISLMSPWR